VWMFIPEIRSVKTECERDERSFMRVAATVRRELATRRREETDAGDGRGITFTSVTRVPDLSCLISCFFLSNSPFPRRSLIVSLYYSFSYQSNLYGATTRYVQSRGTGRPSCTPILWTSGHRQL
jgi:hypothetical protein